MRARSVSIVSGDAGFTRSVIARWQAEADLPAFAVLDPAQFGLALSRTSHMATEPSFDLAVIGHCPAETLSHILPLLSGIGKPAILVGDNLERRLKSGSHLLAVRPRDGWLDHVITLAGQILVRVDAEEACRRMESDLSASRSLAELGRFALEVRHTVNNALTPVLGNSELILATCSGLSDETRAQIETIHGMSVRIHEIMLRFSSLENELKALSHPASPAAMSRAAAE